MKPFATFGLTLWAVFTIVWPASAQRQSAGSQGVRCIVIDAGHGGKDPGANAGRILEKNINLGVALELGRLLTAEFPDLRVVLTRTDDRFVELDQRSRIANDAGADLFISIHTNSAAGGPAAYGTETYVMGEDTGNRNLSVVMRENSVISLEKDYTSRYEGYDPNSAESVIMFSLMQYAYQSQSLVLAETIQREYKSHASRADKGVKAAGFLVLWRTSMPSVLTEVGFISNPAEAAWLDSREGQNKIASALARAVGDYKRTMDQRTISAPPATTTATTTASAAPSAGPPEEAPGVVFRIQVKSSARPMAVNRSTFGDYAPRIKEYRIDGRYKYCYGEAFSYKEALLLQKQVREKHPDAFMVAFSTDGAPIPLAEAIRAFD